MLMILILNTLMYNSSKICDHGSNHSCTLSIMLSLMQKNQFKLYYDHIWSQYQYPIQNILFKIAFKI